MIQLLVEAVVQKMRRILHVHQQQRLLHVMFGLRRVSRFDVLAKCWWSPLSALFQSSSRCSPEKRIYASCMLFAPPPPSPPLSPRLGQTQPFPPLSSKCVCSSICCRFLHLMGPNWSAVFFRFEVSNQCVLANHHQVMRNGIQICPPFRTTGWCAGVVHANSRVMRARG
jgi:hypothetical protein